MRASAMARPRWLPDGENALSVHIDRPARLLPRARRGARPRRSIL